MTSAGSNSIASRGVEVSIVIPCFNAEDTVGEAIDSALSQTHSQIEVIVIDDGSSDNSGGAILRFGGHIRFESGHNRGGGAARNRGIELARGEFVQFLDADDLLLPECVATKLVWSRQYANQTICSDWRRVGCDGCDSVERPAVTDRDSIIALIDGQMQTSSPLHRRARLLHIGGFDPSLPCGQERDLHLRLACHGERFQRLPEVLHIVRRRKGSVSEDYTRVLLQHERIYSSAAAILEQHSALTSEHRHALARALAADGRRLFHRGRVAEARSFWQSARELAPAGLRSAYRSPVSRALASVVGPAVTESLLVHLRRWRRTGRPIHG